MKTIKDTIDRLAVIEEAMQTRDAEYVGNISREELTELFNQGLVEWASSSVGNHGEYFELSDRGRELLDYARPESEATLGTPVVVFYRRNVDNGEVLFDQPYVWTFRDAYAAQDAYEQLKTQEHLHVAGITVATDK